MKEINNKIKVNAYELLILVVLNIIDVIYMIVKRGDYPGFGSVAEENITSTIIAAIIMMCVYMAVQIFIALRFIKTANGTTTKRSHFIWNKIMCVIALVSLIMMIVDEINGGDSYSFYRSWFAIIELTVYGEFWFFERKLKEQMKK